MPRRAPRARDTRLAQPATRSELELLLTEHGVDLRGWGRAGAKTLQHLTDEVVRGECRLVLDAGGKLVREIAVVGVDVLFDDDGDRPLRLVEVEQRFRSGSHRRRQLSTSLGEKRRLGERPLDAARRALEEELGVPSDRVELTRTGHEATVEGSSSYPGLLSRRDLTYFECTLPASLYRPGGYEEHQADKVTRFAWRPAA